MEQFVYKVKNKEININCCCKPAINVDLYLASTTLPIMTVTISNRTLFRKVIKH